MNKKGNKAKIVKQLEAGYTVKIIYFNSPKSEGPFHTYGLFKTKKLVETNFKNIESAVKYYEENILKNG